MKIKTLVALALGLLTTSIQAQNAVPNGNFEQWNSLSFENPKYYQSSNKDVYRTGLTYNCVKVTDAYHGSFALKMTTAANARDTMFAYVVNGNPENDPGSWHGGIPYNQKPTGIRGYYKSNVATGDTALIIVAFSKAGINIGTYVLKLYGLHNSYTMFSQTFSPALSQTPDSVIFAATSSNALIESAVSGSMLQIDSVSFTGVSSQPALLNGSFEEWETTTVETPVKWYINDGNNIPILKTTDLYKGQYAIRLETDQGENNGNPRANPGSVSTGYYLRNCNQCTEQGGYPFSKAVDTLIFWYKYSPASNGKAQVFINLKKNGNNIWGNGLELSAAANYQYAELPIFPGQTPDTLIVNFQSGRWQDSGLAHIGSVLIVDEVQLKSEPLRTGLSFLRRNNAMSLYPNPAGNTLSVHFNINNPAYLRITDIEGREIMLLAAGEKDLQVDVSTLPEGLYLAETIDGNGSVSVLRFSIRR